LEEKTKKSVKNGVKEGLSAGIEAGSYDALKAVAKATGQLYPSGASSSAAASPAASARRQEAAVRSNTEKLSTLEGLLRQILDATKASSASLASLGTF
jgi:hypothetical protein